MTNPPELPLIEMLRELNKEVKPVAINELLPALTKKIDAYIKQKYASGQRVAVFGPYPNDGERILNFVAQSIASRGHVAIMGSGFYAPNDPKTFHGIANIFPPELSEFLQLRRLEFYLYRNILPSISDKAVVNLHPARTNVFELEGCYEENLTKGQPLLGYIISSAITQPTNPCDHLVVDQNADGLGMKCEATSETHCTLRAEDNCRCPFIDPAKIPRITRQWFLTLKNWKLIALNNIEKIDTYLDEFLARSDSAGFSTL